MPAIDEPGIEASAVTGDHGGGLAPVTYLPGVDRSGADLPGADPRGVDREAEVRRAEGISMRALARRGLSRRELGELLLGKELDPGIVEGELDRLERVGLIDDAALAETVVRTQRERKGLGRAALVAELRRRGVGQHDIDAALERLGDDEERRLAIALAVTRARQLTGLDRETAVRRLTGYLMRKGYGSSAVRAAVEEALPPSGGGVRFR